MNKDLDIDTFVETVIERSDIENHTHHIEEID